MKELIYTTPVFVLGCFAVNYLCSEHSYYFTFIFTALYNSSDNATRVAQDCTFQQKRKVCSLLSIFHWITLGLINPIYSPS